MNTMLFQKLSHMNRWFAAEERAASLVEMGLLVGLVAVVAIVAVTQVGSKVNGIFSNAETTLTDYSVVQTWSASCFFGPDDHVSMSPVVGKRGDAFTTSGLLGDDPVSIYGIIGGAATVELGEDAFGDSCSNWSATE